MYHDNGYRGAIKALTQGKSIDTSDRVDRIYVDIIKERTAEKQKKAEARAKKVKRRIWFNYLIHSLHSSTVISISI